MVKFTVFNKKTGKFTVGFGISEGNIELLKQGKPIFVNGEELNSNSDFMIFYGKTEKDMYEMVQEFIGPDTVVKGVD